MQHLKQTTFFYTLIRKLPDFPIILRVLTEIALTPPSHLFIDY